MNAPHDEELQELTVEQCWALVRREELGRLATTVGQDLDIFPITYRVDGRSIYFRTSPGRKLAAMSISPRVAIEIDGHDDTSAWSVVAKGTARHLLRIAELDVAEDLDVRSWLPADLRDFVRVDVETVSGRTFRFGPERSRRMEDESPWPGQKPEGTLDV
jgi:hypothetical protein